MDKIIQLLNEELTRCQLEQSQADPSDQPMFVPNQVRIANAIHILEGGN